jgi:hypothetical protein
MENKQEFLDYLKTKGSDEGYIKECAMRFDTLAADFDNNPDSQSTIDAFLMRLRGSSVENILANHDFLNEVAAFMKEQNPALAKEIRTGCAREKHRADIRASRGRIAPVPDDLKINPQHLGGFTNAQFLQAFRDLQQFVIACYNDIEHDPLAWGYANPYSTNRGYGGHSIGPHDIRLTSLLYALGKAGKLDNDVLIVERNAFNSHFKRWNTKPEPMMSGIARMGFEVKDYGKKSAASFTVLYPANPHVLQAIRAYFTGRPCRRCYGACSHMGSCYWYAPITPVTVFSYRFIEDPSEQRHESGFLALVSGMPEEAREIQYYLYSESKRYNYRFDPFKPVLAGTLLYENGPKDFPRVGIICDGWSGDDYRMFYFRSHVKFKRVFETHPEKIEAFMQKRPDVFDSKSSSHCNLHCGNTLSRSCPAHRVTYEFDGVTYHNCGGFRINNPTLEDVKAIVELYVLEHELIER